MTELSIRRELIIAARRDTVSKYFTDLTMFANYTLSRDTSKGDQIGLPDSAF